MRRLSVLILFAMALASCGDPPQPVPASVTLKPITDKNGSAVSPPAEQRFLITRLYVIRDRLAYGGERGVYTIVDMHTGREMVGVSGIGITETGEVVRTMTSGRMTTTTRDPIEQ